MNIIEIVNKQLKAYNECNFTEFSSCYAKDIKSYDFDSGCLIKEMCGEKFFEYYQKKFKSNPKIHCEVINRITHDNLVVDKERIDFYEGSSHEEMVVYRLKDSLITDMWFSKEVRI